MKKALVSGLTLLAALAFAPSPALAAEEQSAAPDTAPVAATSVEGVPTDAPTVVFLTREEHENAIGRRALAKPASSVNMTFHNGPIMVSSAVEVIYWGPSWSNASFYRDKISGLASFYQGFNNSNYAGTSTEYTGTNGQVTRASSWLGSHTDLSKASGGNRTSPILAEVCKEIVSPVTNGFYPVYTDLPRGHAGYCAWHSWGSCNGTPVQFAFFWNLDGDAGCDPESGIVSESQGLAALANVSAHELSEAMTDPRGTGWFDSSGAENGDKCAWTFNVPSVTFSNHSEWKLQGEWSNKAYNAGTGYPNRSSQKGCLDGH